MGKTILCIFLNTNFSLLGVINGDYNFLPLWKPHFIKNNISQDQCHLNGLAMQNGEPKYVTALSTTNEAQGWRKHKLNGGVLMDVKTNSIILDKLQMPHSPRIYKDKLYFLQSASGTISQMDMKTNEIEKTKELKGFVRGMDIYNDYAFIGLSKIRETSQAFGDMPISQYDNRAGFVLFHLPTFSIVGEVVYENSVDEIFDIKVIPNVMKPNILNTMDESYKELIVYPNTAFWATEGAKETRVLEVRKYFAKEEHFKHKSDVLNYTIYDIYKTRDYDHFIIDFWLTHKILNQKEAFKRVSEVASIVVDSNNNIVGLTTLYEENFKKENCYFLREVVSPKSPSFLVWQKLLAFSVNSFNTRYKMNKSANVVQPEKVIMEIENKKLDTSSAKAIFAKIGWEENGVNDKNQTLYVYDFTEQRDDKIS